MINIYKRSVTFPVKPATVDNTEPALAPIKQQHVDFQPPSVGSLPTRVSQSVINFVVKSRGQRDPFTPFINRNPLQRNFFGGMRRTRGFPKDVVLEGPDYDFREINKVVSLDGYVSRAMNTLISASLNGRRGYGFYFESYDPGAKEYIERRLDETTFTIKGEGSVPNLMRKIMTSFITKSNVILWLRRRTRDIRKQYQWRGTYRNEIMGLEVIDPSMIDVARSPETNAVVGFNLVTETYEDTIPMTDCYLLKWEDMQQDNLFARPLIAPVLDDILTLRKLEEIHELAMAKATFPLIHVAIGDPKNIPQVFGVSSIDTEVHRAQAAMEEAAPEGFLVTPGWYKIDIVQPRNIADFLPYMQYYRTRIIVGLGVDDTSMGISNTANRSTAAQMSLQLMEKVREIRAAVADELNRTLIRELLVEGGYSPIGKSAVFLRWEDPDLESLMAWENHTLAMYQGGVLTLSEARESLGREKLSPEEEKDLFQYRAGQIEAKFNPTVNKPTNQHKTSASKPSRARKRDYNLRQFYVQALNVCQTSPYLKRQALDTHFKNMRRHIYRYILERYHDEVHERIVWIEKELLNDLEGLTDKADIARVFDTHTTYLEALEDRLVGLSLVDEPEEQEEQRDQDTGLHERQAGE